GLQQRLRPLVTAEGRPGVAVQSRFEVTVGLAQRNVAVGGRAAGRGVKRGNRHCLLLRLGFVVASRLLFASPWGRAFGRILIALPLRRLGRLLVKLVYRRVEIRFIDDHRRARIIRVIDCYSFTLHVISLVRGGRDSPPSPFNVSISPPIAWRVPA